MALSPEKILGDVLRMHPHTKDGQWAVAEYVRDLIQEHNLGTAEIIPCPIQFDGPGEEHPFVKVIAEFGTMPSGVSRTLMTWLGHLDTVPPTGKQIDSEPLTFVHENGNLWGIGRGTNDMWSGNIAYILALEQLKAMGSTRQAIQLILSSREESGSEVLYRALYDEKIEQAPVGATTEILVGDNGVSSPVYRARTGRIGIESRFFGKAPHAGSVNRHRKFINEIAHRYLGRALDETLDDERGFAYENRHPRDSENILPPTSHAIPGHLRADPKGLSVPGEILQHWNFFHAQPDLAPELLATHFLEYLEEKCHIPKECLNIRLENRNGVPFIPPWLTPADHPLVQAAGKCAEEVEGSPVPVGSADGVAEEGMLTDFLGTQFVGWAPVGRDAHEEDERVLMKSIGKRAEWLTKLAQHDGNLG